MDEKKCCFKSCVSNLFKQTFSTNYMESRVFLFTSIPLFAIILVFGYLNIQQEVRSDVKIVNQEELCKTVEYNGEDRIDLLFISTEEEARRYTEVLLGAEPYKSKRNYFNSRVIENKDVECNDYQGKAILCNTLEVQNLAKQCPYDYISVVKEKPANIRSSAYANIISLNSAHEDSVFLHEMGHAFANLAEEYGGAKVPSGAKNCVSSCNKFNGPIDSCEVECSESNLVRSIPVGIMRTLANPDYGIYNDALIEKILEKNKPKDSVVTGNQINDLASCNNPLVKIIIENKDQKITAKSDNILEKGCFAPDKVGEGALCIGNDLNKVCYPDVIFTDRQDIQTQETLDGETLSYQEETIFYINQDSNNPFVDVTLNGELVSTINTAQAGATACKI